MVDGINGIKDLIGKGLDATKGSTEVTGENRADFAKALKNAISSVNNVQKDADIAVEKFAKGDASLHETMIAIEKAGVSFQLMLQVRNKIVSAYEEIMRTQI
ncbi:MAG: flagellar hook-basal body complex protein FliE [Proteobacteria bacterium]|nr:flagellar hook-basal body complex protein FliE [Pseudomonadota bacterium]